VDSTAVAADSGDPEWLTVAEVATASGMSAQAVHKAISSNRLRATRVTEGNRELWRVSARDAWLFAAARRGRIESASAGNANTVEGTVTVARGRLSEAEYASLVETLKLLRAANDHQIAELADGIAAVRGQLDRISAEVDKLHNISLLVTRLLESLDADAG
jgi:hypothetical protein